MYRIAPTVTILAAFVVLCFTSNAAAQPYSIPNTEVRAMHSKNSGADYLLTMPELEAQAASACCDRNAACIDSNGAARATRSPRWRGRRPGHARRVWKVRKRSC